MLAVVRLSCSSLYCCMTCKAMIHIIDLSHVFVDASLFEKAALHHFIMHLAQCRVRISPQLIHVFPRCSFPMITFPPLTSSHN